jgi:hypothetical protein
MIRSDVVVLFALVFSASALPARAQWTPPIGIPAPSFGVVETARPVPSPWTTATAGFYYVNASHTASTDSSNPNGTPARPRKTIPNSLPAGAVVELHGTYDRLHTSPNTIVANGTAAAPVFIRGASAAAMPVIRAAWELSGAYVILENLEFAPLDASRTGELVMLAPLHHASLRHSNLHGNLVSGGLGIVSWSSALTHNVVVFNNSIHDNGDLNASYDQDVHGIVVNARVSHLWVVDNRLYRNSGDGIQINAGSTANQSTTHHIYVGRNTAYNNKQTGMWAKQAVDVIFSQNRCYGHRPSNSSMGMCMGYQYATERMWFLYNVISDSEFGIGVGSNHDGVGVDAAFVGNIIYNIHHSGTGYNPSTAWASAGIMLAGGQYARVVNNTIYNVDAGINVPFALSSLEVADNIIGQVTVSASNHVFVEDAGLVSRMSMHHNLFEGTPRTRLAGSQKVLTAAQLAASWSLAGSPSFVNATGGDFRLQSSSAAIDRGETSNPVYASFQQRYGLSIARDPYGAARPTGAAIDMGGFEFGGCGTLQPPATPIGMTATVSGQSLTLQWTQPTSCSVATNYLLEAGSAPGLSNLGTSRTGSTATAFTDSNVAPGTYYIRVKAENPAGVSAASNEVTVAVGVPGPPRNLTGSVSGSIISLSWQAPAIGAAPTGYVIEIGTAAGRTDLTKSVPVTTLAHAGTAVPGTYYIRVRAITIAGVGAASNEVTVVVR